MNKNMPIIALISVTAIIVGYTISKMNKIRNE
jgi:hypothetical protein